MDIEQFKELKKAIKKPDGCTVCGGRSSRSVLCVEGDEIVSTYYCKEHFNSEVKNVRRKNAGRNK